MSNDEITNIAPTSVDETIVINLSNAAGLGTSGQIIDVILPDGLVASLWVFADKETASVDVRKRESAESTDSVPLVRTFNIGFPGQQPTVVVAVLKAEEPK